MTREIHDRILDGAAIAADIRAEVAEQVAALAPRAGRPPGLAVVLPLLIPTLDLSVFEGRLTLNPIPHIDPLGTVILPVILLFSNAGFLIVV